MWDNFHGKPITRMVCGTYVLSKQWFDEFAQFGLKKVRHSARLSGGGQWKNGQTVNFGLPNTTFSNYILFILSLSHLFFSRLVTIKQKDIKFTSCMFPPVLRQVSSLVMFVNCTYFCELFFPPVLRQVRTHLRLQGAWERDWRAVDVQHGNDKGRKTFGQNLQNFWTKSAKNSDKILRT